MLGNYFKRWFLVLVFCCLFSLLSTPAAAATTQVHIVKFASDNITIINQTTITYQAMEKNLPVQGDGITHYYLQGPVFVDNADPVRQEQLRWNAAEDTNVKEKDMGAVKGTDLKDLCNLVGGMEPGDLVKLKAEDGFTKIFAFENVYTPSARQGPMVITWYDKDEGYVPAYRQGMRLVFFADNSTNPFGVHTFGNEDWHVSASPQYYYFYQQGNERYPTTTGLSVQYVSEIQVYSPVPAKGEQASPSATTPSTAPTRAGPSLVTSLFSIAACVIMISLVRKRA
jgi:hypothetical protein